MLTLTVVRSEYFKTRSIPWLQMIRDYTGSSLVQVIAWHLFGGQAITWTDDDLLSIGCSGTNISVTEMKTLYLFPRKCIWKCHIEHGYYSVKALMYCWSHEMKCLIWIIENLSTQEHHWLQRVNTSRPRQNGCHFADNVFKCICMNENVWIAFKVSLRLVPKGPINNIPALV